MLQKNIITAVVLLLVLAVCSCSQDVGQQVNVADIRVLFSPGGGCTEAIVAEVSRAKTEIRVQAYSFTSKPIAKAIGDAHKRGVRVEIILDKSNRSSRYSAGDFTANAGILTFIDDVHAIAHNKVMIIDGETVITGSFNFTKAAEEKNAENLLIIRNRDIAGKYLKNWEDHRRHSEGYSGKQGRA